MTMDFTVNLSNFNTNNVFDMSKMLDKCKLINELNLSNINTSNVNNIRYMFDGCSLLKELNLYVLFHKHN